MNQVKQSVNLNESGAKTVWASYHCIGERATQILNSIEQPYPMFISFYFYRQCKQLCVRNRQLYYAI